MSSSDSRWNTIRRALTRAKETPKTFKLEQLMGMIKRGKTSSSERLEPSEVLMRRAELLYRLEPLIFSGVNKLTRRITGAKVYFTGGDEKENEIASKFFKESGALELLPHLTKDAFIYGFGAAEITKERGESRLGQIDPKDFDYQREGAKVKLDDQGNIIGYVWKNPNTLQSFPMSLAETLLIRFYALGVYSLGVSPIEAAFKSAWIKLNLEEALGEAIYRHGFPLVKYIIGSPEPTNPFHEVTPEKIKQAKKIIASMDTGTELVLPWWIDAQVMKTGKIENVALFIQILSMDILAALELPKAFGIETSGVGGRAVEEMDFEKTVLAFQEELKRQLDDQLLTPFYNTKKFKTHPALTFVEYAPELQNVKLRRLSAYARHGLITRNDELENELRKAEGFPLKKKKDKDTISVKCIFELGDCPIRQEEDMPLDKLSAFCNICIKRLKEEGRSHGSGEDAKKSSAKD